MRWMNQLAGLSRAISNVYCGIENKVRQGTELYQRRAPVGMWSVSIESWKDGDSTILDWYLSPQPYPGSAAVLSNEFNTCGFEGGADGVNRVIRYNPPLLLKVDYCGVAKTSRRSESSLCHRDQTSRCARLCWCHYQRFSLTPCGEGFIN